MSSSESGTTLQGSQSHQQQVVDLFADQPNIQRGTSELVISRPRLFGSMRAQGPMQKFTLMLNQLTLKDYEKKIQNFDFKALVETETVVEITKAVLHKVKHNPMASEFFVKIVLSKIDQAYDDLNAKQKDSATSSDFFNLLCVDILENEASLCKKEQKLSNQLDQLHSINANQRTVQEKKTIDDKEDKQIQVRRDIFVGFKLIGDLLHNGHLDMSVANDILRKLSKDTTASNLNFINFGKAALLICGIGSHLTCETSQSSHQLTQFLLQNAHSSIQRYNHKEMIIGEGVLADLNDLLLTKQFTNYYECRPILKRIYNLMYGLKITLAEDPYIMFKQNH